MKDILCNEMFDTTYVSGTFSCSVFDFYVIRVIDINNRTRALRQIPTLYYGTSIILILE